MALQKRQVEIQLDGGLNTKSDPKKVPQGQTTELINWQYDELGQLRKRNGFDSFGDSGLGDVSTIIGSRTSLYALGDDAYKWNTDQLSWETLNATEGAGAASFPFKQVEVTARPVDGDVGRGDVESDIAYNAANNLSVVAWSSTQDTNESSSLRSTFVMIVDQDGNKVTSPVELSDERAPRLVPTATNHVLLFTYGSSGTNLYARPIVVSTLSVGSRVTVATDCARAAIDATEDPAGDFAWVVYEESTGNQVRIRKVGTSGSSVHTGLSTEVVSGQMAVYKHPDTASLFIVYTNGTSNFRILQYTEGGGFTGPTVVSTSGGTVQSVAVTKKTSTSVLAFLRTSTTLSYKEVDSSLVVGAGNTGRDLYMAAKPVYGSDGNVYMLIGDDRESGTRPALFWSIVTLSGSLYRSPIVARARQEVAEGARTGVLPSTTIPASNMYETAGLSRRQLFRTGGIDDYRKSMDVLRFDMRRQSPIRRAEVDGIIYAASGHLWAIEGERVREAAHHTSPSFNGAPTVNATGGNIDAISSKTFLYRLTIEFIDNNGEIVRGPLASEIKEVTVNTSTNTASVVFPVSFQPQFITHMLGATLKFHRKARYALYRTTDTGAGSDGVFFRVADLEVGAGDITDTVSDDDLVDNEPLYTTGGIIENDPPPPCSDVLWHNGRLWLVDSEDPTRVMYSKKKVDGVAPEFSSAFVHVAPERIVRLAGLGGSVFAFSEHSIYVTSGDGPNAAGVGGQFTPWAQVPSPVGCSEPNSVVTTPNGVMFKSLDGIQLLTRSLSVEPVGAAVQAYDSLTVESATLVGQHHEVRFCVSGSDDVNMLAYDYQSDKWTTYNVPIDPADSTVWLGDFLYLENDSFPSVREEASDFTDDATYIPGTIVTPWIRTAGIAGFQRVRRMALVGERVGAHGLTVSIGYDYSSTFADTRTYSEAELTTAGSEFIRIHVPRQKCSAIRFKIEDTAPASGPGEGLRVSALQLELGVKRGQGKQIVEEARK